MMVISNANHHVSRTNQHFIPQERKGKCWCSALCGLKFGSMLLLWLHLNVRSQSKCRRRFWQDWHFIFVPREWNGNGKSGVVRVPGVHLVCHHDMLRRVLDHAPQRVLHPGVEAVLVLCLRLQALAGFARCVWWIIAGKVFAAVAAACKSQSHFSLLLSETVAPLALSSTVLFNLFLSFTRIWDIRNIIHQLQTQNVWNISKWGDSLFMCLLYTCVFSLLPVCEVEVPLEPDPDPDPREPPDSPEPDPEALEPVPDLASSCSSRSSSSLDVDWASWFPDTMGLSPWSRQRFNSQN